MSERETMECDVVIVGAGPAGLAAAFRLAQLSRKHSQELSIIVLEKGAEVGAHILSGLVMDPIGLNELFPEWINDKDFPLTTQVLNETFQILTPERSFPLPNFLLPPFIKNHGNLVGSLGEFCRWLASKTEELGVEIYSGISVTDFLLDDKNQVCGVVTGDMGLDRNGNRKTTYTAGMNLKARYTLLAEGARGSLTRKAFEYFSLDQECDPQHYSLGIKELWKIPKNLHRSGTVTHSIGWPLGLDTSGGGFAYHYGEDLLSLGLVIPLTYDNPTLSPFDEFQKFKTHPSLFKLLENSERLEYGARVISEGGLQSIPKVFFPGGALIGDSAGFVNAARIKGTHNALLSGLICADAVFPALQKEHYDPLLRAYETSLSQSLVYKDLSQIRNFKPLWSRFGFTGALLAGAVSWFQTIFRFSLLGTMHLKEEACHSLKEIKSAPRKVYEKPNQKQTFDRLSSLPFSQVNHEEDQPCHLILKDPSIPTGKSLLLYGEPSQLYCPAKVYEIVYDDEETLRNPRFIIHASNCIHCKTCDIKDPFQNIRWLPPEGGGGPNYQRM